MHKCTKILVLIVLVILFSENKTRALIFAGGDSVKWVSEYPSAESGKLRKSFAQKVSEVVFGKTNDNTLLKPIYILCLGKDSSVVFDQGSGSIFLQIANNSELKKITGKQLKNFPSLVSACLISNKKILFTDSKTNMIYSISRDLKSIVPFSQTVFNQPTGIAYSGLSNEIWVVETGLHKISVLDIKGNKIREFGKRGSGKLEFNFPTSVCFDNEGSAYVVDAMNFRIQILNTKGEFISMFGSPGNATGNMARPKGIAVDSQGHIYVSDALFNTIQIFNKNGDFLYNFGKQGQEQGDFWMPSGLFIDKKDNIYVADYFNSRIQVFQYIK